jgi:peptide chain release factor 3
MTDKREINAEEDKFTGFVFKIHANIDPRHRDRVAFLRVCSGKFERNTFYHHVRLNKNVRFSNPYTFLAREKNVVEMLMLVMWLDYLIQVILKLVIHYPKAKVLMYVGIPSFSPEIFKELINNDPMKTKQLEKGVESIDR